ncbi:MAG TPA: hypothetical protein VHW06_21515 [Streptosporangiaceae bacterium]|nr:hypothetical protein [Streptosporangiaceae bacterium]
MGRPGPARERLQAPTGDHRTGYADTWRELTGQPLPPAQIQLGYRWAALQIPAQYLPWTAAHRPTSDYIATLDQIDQALTQLTQISRLGP